jgi:hypothetical protein
MKLPTLLRNLLHLLPQSPRQTPQQPTVRRPPGNDRSGAASLRTAIEMGGQRQVRAAGPAAPQFSASLPPATAAELAARALAAKPARDAAIHEAAVAWDAIMIPGRAAIHARGPNDTTFRPPAHDFDGYRERWNTATRQYDAALAQARQSYEDALDPVRTAALKTVGEAQVADAAAIAAVDAERANFLQFSSLQYVSREAQHDSPQDVHGVAIHADAISREANISSGSGDPAQEFHALKNEASATLQNAITRRSTTAAEVAATTEALVALSAKGSDRKLREQAVQDANAAQTADLAARKVVRLARDNLLKVEAQKKGSA